jgi:hypothetical protein
LSNELAGHVKRLFDLYEGKTKDFQIYFAILIGISLFLIFFMLLPYVSTQESRHQISERINQISTQINNINATVGPLENAKDGINSLYAMISNGAEELRTFITSLEKIRQQPYISL